MTDRNSTIDQLFVAGEYGRVLELTRHAQPDVRSHPVRTAMTAQAIFEAGDVERSRAWAALCAESTHAAARARGQLVLALSVRSMGDMVTATQLLQSAMRSAEEGRDDELEAWISVFLLRHMFVGGRELGEALVPATRARAVKAGSAQVTAYLHATIAVAEGQAGRPREARRHLRRAGQLLAAKPHAWVRCSVLATTAAIALAERNIAEAVACLDELRTTSREQGLAADYARASVNLGNLAFYTGRYSEADAALTEAIESPLTSRIAKLTAADTLAQLRLAQGRLGDCEEILNDIERAATAGSLMTVFGVLWARLTRARLLLQGGHARAAVQVLTSLESDLGASSDRPLIVSTRMTAALAHVANGDSAAAARHLASTLMLDPAAIVELQGQFYFSAASTVSRCDRRLADALRTRARRLWAFQGTSALESTFSTVGSGSTDGGSVQQRFDGSDESVTVEAIASLFALASHPTLLAQELKELIERLGCSPRVELLQTSEPAGRHPAEVELRLPSTDASALTLKCSLPDRPSQAVTLGSIIRIGHSAIELERVREAERRRAALWPDASAEASAGAIFESAAMRDVLTVARRIADTSVPVLITGETGTGKEVFARLIHAYSTRANAVFAPFNCTSLSRDMIESQLFGHRKGAFTGATDHSQGVVRAANRGTLLLDEIGDMHIDVQPKLLRFLASGEIHPLGEVAPTQVDVRIIAATNADLKALVANGKFREDLYYRLSIVPLHLPPLRERRGEIPSLATHYLTKHGREFGKGDLRLSEDALECLLLYRWPGNIRQLANEMRRIAALADVDAVVMPEHLSADISGFSAARKTEIARREPRDNEVTVRLDQPLAAAVEHIERAMIVNALSRTDGGVERAATMLGLSRKGLYLKRQKYGIDTDTEAPEFVADGAE